MKKHETRSRLHNSGLVSYSLCSKASFLFSSVSNSPTLKVGDRGAVKSKFPSLEETESSILILGWTEIPGDIGELGKSCSEKLYGVMYSVGIHPSRGCLPSVLTSDHLLRELSITSTSSPSLIDIVPSSDALYFASVSHN